MMERWPPVYDAEDLARHIKELVSSDRLEDEFYDNRRSGLPDICQGDVISLPSRLPLINARGTAVATDPVATWMVIGNTCDFVRDLDTCRYTQVVPLVDLGDDTTVSEEARKDLRSYRAFRTFYVPAWMPYVHGRYFIADFTRPVTVHKTALSTAARVEARLSPRAWILLNSCIVRFLARDDGRWD